MNSIEVNNNDVYNFGVFANLILNFKLMLYLKKTLQTRMLVIQLTKKKKKKEECC